MQYTRSPSRAFFSERQTRSYSIVSAEGATPELNERLSYLQTRNNPADVEEFTRLYQERRELLKELGPAAASICQLDCRSYPSFLFKLTNRLTCVTGRRTFFVGGSSSCDPRGIA